MEIYFTSLVFKHCGIASKMENTQTKVIVTKGDSFLNKLGNNKFLVHVVLELLGITAIAYYLNSKINAVEAKITTPVTDQALLDRIAELEQKLIDIQESFGAALGNIRQSIPVIVSNSLANQPKPMYKPQERKLKKTVRQRQPVRQKPVRQKPVRQKPVRQKPDDSNQKSRQNKQPTRMNKLHSINEEKYPTIEEIESDTQEHEYDASQEHEFDASQEHEFDDHDHTFNDLVDDDEHNFGFKPSEVGPEPSFDVDDAEIMAELQELGLDGLD
jgi:hypothetical protein